MKRNDTDRERRKKAEYSDPYAPLNFFMRKSQSCKHAANCNCIDLEHPVESM